MLVMETALEKVGGQSRRLEETGGLGANENVNML